MTPVRAGTSAEAPKNLRLFVALELPLEWKEALAEVQREQERAAPGYFRWVQPELVHLTLVFLGWQPAQRLDEVAAAVNRAAAEIPTFRLTLGHVGTFGPPRAPRVLWVEALQPDGRLQQLRAALERELRAAAISFDDKPLVPHVTLARKRDGSSGPIRLGESVVASAPHTVRQIVLMESKLSPRGPSYNVRAAAALVS
jgi:2'-5' RNA ligase